MTVRHSRYWQKLFLLMLVLSVLPASLIGLFSYEQASRVIQNKVNEANSHTLYQTQMRTEEGLRYLYNHYTLLADSPEVSKRIDQVLSYKEYEEIQKIQNGLLEPQKLQNSIKSAYLVNINKNWMISNAGVSVTSGVIALDNFKNLLAHSGNIFWNYSAEDIYLSSATQTTLSGNIQLVVKVPLNTVMPYGAIVVNLNQSEFRKSIRGDAAEARTIVADANGVVLYHDDNSKVGSSVTDFPVWSSLRMGDAPQGFYQIRVGDELMSVSFSRSEFNGWTYLSYDSITASTRDVRAIGWVTIALVAGIGLLGMGLALAGSRFLYRPVSSIYRNLQGIAQSQDPDSKDEFAYIGRSITRMAESNQQMEVLLQKQLGQLEELFLIRLVSGELTPEQIEQKLETLHVRRSWSWMCVLVLRVDEFTNTKYAHDDHDILMLKLCSIAQGVLGDKCLFSPVVHKQSVLVLAGEAEGGIEQYKDSMFSAANQLQQVVVEGVGFSSGIGLSRPFRKLGDAKIAYMEATEALLCQRGVGGEAVLFYEDVLPGKYIRITYPKLMEDKLLEALHSGDETGTLELLDAMIDEIYREKVSYREHQFSANRLLTAILRSLQDSSTQLGGVLQGKSNILEDIYRIHQPEALKVWFRESLINPVIPELRALRVDRTKAILSEVMRMIEEEYDTDISIEECAVRLNYHPSYIWRILRNEMNTSFSDALSRKRLETACKWLKDTRMPVGEIAERLRYTNAQNFIRYFKKHTGITPGQYREQELNREQ